MKARATSVLLCMLLVLTEVQSQTFPFVLFMGNNIPNHGYVDLNAVDTTNSITCNTNLFSCCSSPQGPDRGDWYLPNGRKVPFSGNVSEERGAEQVHLRYTGSGGTSGIYHCDIETNAVNNNDGHATLYIGLYASGGDVIIPDGMYYTVDFDLNGANPQVTIICISTGGPATTVTWTRDSQTVSGGTTVLDDPVSAKYTHTLMVTAIQGGQYRCTVANDKPSEATASCIVAYDKPSEATACLNMQAPGKLTARIEFTTPTSIFISWNATGKVDSYRLTWKRTDRKECYFSEEGSVLITDGSTNYTIIVLLEDEQYNVTVTATNTFGSAVNYLATQRHEAASDSGNVNVGVIVGAVVGSVLGLIVIFVLFLFVLHRYVKLHKIKPEYCPYLHQET